MYSEPSSAHGMLPRSSALMMTSTATLPVKRQMRKQASKAWKSISRSNRRPRDVMVFSRGRVTIRPRASGRKRHAARGSVGQHLLQLGNVVGADLGELGPVDVVRLLRESRAEIDNF